MDFWVWPLDSLDDTAQPSKGEPGDSTWHKGWSGTDRLAAKLIRAAGPPQQTGCSTPTQCLLLCPQPWGCLPRSLGQGHWSKACAAVPQTAQGLLLHFATGLSYWRVQRCSRAPCGLEEVRLSAVRSLLAKIMGWATSQRESKLSLGRAHRRGARQSQMWTISSAVSPVWSLCLAAPWPFFTQQYKSCTLGKARVLGLQQLN